jgi:hypothetical protein
LTVFLTLLENPERLGLGHQHIGSAIVALAPALDEPTAARAAKLLDTAILKSNRIQFLFPSYAKALAAVCRRLSASEAADHVNPVVDFILREARDITKDKDKVNYSWQVEALGALCGQLDADRASRVAAALITILGDGRTFDDFTDQFISRQHYVAVLTKVAGCLDTPGSLRAAEDLILVLRKGSEIVLSLRELRAALGALCRRQDAAGAARVAEALVDAVRDPKTAVLVHVLFVDALTVLADRLTPDQTVALERALVECLLADLTDRKSRRFNGQVAQGLANLCARPGATAATRTAELLVAAIGDPQTPLSTLKPLAEALGEVSGRLPSEKASSHLSRAIKALDSLWAATTSPQDRSSIAEALAALWTRIDSGDAAARAKRTAADLEEALRDSKSQSYDMAVLASALSAVYSHLDPAERSRRANSAADYLVAAVRQPRKNAVTASQLSTALATLCAHQDRRGVVRTADALFDVLDDPSIQPVATGLIPATHLDVFLVYETLFDKVATRLDEHDLQRFLNQPFAVGRFQRAVLNVLSRSKNRSFRNTWDYLDWRGQSE